MKRMILLAAAVMLLLPLRAQQPEDGVARHAVKFNLLSPIARSLDFNYEYRIANRSAVAFDLGGNFLKPLSRPMTTHVMFMQAQYRFYLNNQRRNGVMPFFGVGANFTRAWVHFNCFTGNDGWNIHTARYTIHDQALRPAIAFGIKVNIPFGLTIESTIGTVLGLVMKENNGISGEAMPVYFGSQFSTRIGWAF